MNHTEMNAALQSHERACGCRAMEHAEKAESLRDEKRRVMGSQSGVPDHIRAIQERRYDDDIAHHEHQAAVHRRRQEYAGRGYLLSSSDEATDSEYQRDHHELIAAMSRAGRVRHAAAD